MPTTEELANEALEDALLDALTILRLLRLRRPFAYLYAQGNQLFESEYAIHHLNVELNGLLWAASQGD